MFKLDRPVSWQFGISGGQDDRQFWILLLDSLGKLESIHPRHGVVGHNDIERWIGFQQFQGVSPGLSLGDAVTEIEQHICRSHADQYVVIYQQDAQASRLLRRRIWSFSAHVLGTLRSTRKP